LSAGNIGRITYAIQCSFSWEYVNWTQNGTLRTILFDPTVVCNYSDMQCKLITYRENCTWQCEEWTPLSGNSRVTWSTNAIVGG